MSVIEFFINYWDWYLLIGGFVGMASLLDAVGDSWRNVVSTALVTVVIWPVSLISMCGLTNNQWRKT